jgi:hypothetical protein
MVSNNSNLNGYNVMPTLPVTPSGNYSSNFSNTTSTEDCFQGSSAPEKKGKNWIPHWLATSLAWVGGIGAGLACSKFSGNSILNCTVGALSGLGFEWFRQENNDGKISYGSLAMNTVLSGLPLDRIFGKMFAGASKEGQA